MINVNDFEDFLINKLFEDNRGNGINELPFVLSIRLHDLLKSINHPIADKILELDKKRKNNKITFVDIDDNDFNKFTIVNSNKVYDNILKYNPNLDYNTVISTLTSMRPNDDYDMKQIYWTKNRVPIKIGSFINKIYPNVYKQGGEPGKDVESFVQTIIAKRSKKKEFKLVSGEDIVKYYYEDNYDLKNSYGEYLNSSPLGNSCMRYTKCQDYVQFYADNNVKMLILLSDKEDDKIVGRAIVWELSEPSGRTFMDRIYYTSNDIVPLFKEYAEKNGWLYKEKQNMEAYTNIVDPINDKIKWILMKTNDIFTESDYYPYMDTMKWFHINDGYLTNEESIDDDVYTLESTNGGYIGGIYVDYYGQSYPEEDLIWCEYGDDYRLDGDAIYLDLYDNYATNTFADDNVVYSGFDDTLYLIEDVVYSDNHQDWLFVENSILLSKSADVKNVDEIEEYDDNYMDISDIDNGFVIEYEYNNKYYYFDKEENEEYFVKAKNYITGVIEYKHKILDKKNLLKVNNEWYYVIKQSDKDKLTGQLRIWEKRKN